ncbi:MAG: NIP7 N-terminal domain-related protein [Nitrososphaera sp.]|jgi:ribosome biogenesis protein Nip4
MTYRLPTRNERTLINRALDRWGAFDALQSSTFMIKNDRVVCLIAEGILKRVAELDPFSAGLAIGEVGKQQFSPALAGADLFARVGSRNKFYVSVNENAEQLVLYGRDVMGDSIIDVGVYADLGENELVIITNRASEAIGVGRTRFSGRRLLQKGRITITTLVDAGRYLRDEGGSGERQTKMVRSSSPRRH